MFIVTLSAVMIIATLFMIITWIFFKQGKQKLTSLLIIPYFFYFVMLLMFDNEDQVLEVYLNHQIYTLSLGYFAVHAMLTLFIVSEMIKALECKGSKANDNLQ